MAGHLMIPALDDTYPATLSKKITTDLLRNELNFKGIIITDALEMKAITNKYTIGQIAELTINAGVNVLLMPENDDDLLNALEKLIENDSEFKNKVRNSIELIISAKRWAGIMPQFHRDDMNANLFTEHPYKALKYAYKGLKFIGNDELLPLKDINSIAVFSLLQKSEYMDNASRFMKMLGDATEFDIDFAFLDANIKQENIDEYINLTMDTELIIFPVFFRNQTYANSIAFPDTMKEAVRQISADKKTIIIFFGSPYFEKEFDPDLKIMTYSDSYASLAATIVKLSGRSIDWIED
jgi:beta-glucosidase-like glycosyl hydrolase